MKASKKIQEQVWQIQEQLLRVGALGLEPDVRNKVIDALGDAAKILIAEGEKVARDEAGESFARQLEVKFDA